jgi:hypothetical protein
LKNVFRELNHARAKSEEDFRPEWEGVYMVCAWREEDGCWVTDCHHEFVINEGTPRENDMQYCCYCGRTIEQFPEEKQEC